MGTPTWKCCLCSAEGFDYPSKCPTCEQWDIETLEAGVRLQLQGWRDIRSRIESVAYTLNCSSENIEVDGETVSLSWEAPACGCGCCGYETHRREFPIRYLWLSNDAIKAEEKALKEAEARAKAEEERQQKLEEAEQALQRAQTHAQTAAQDAARNLAAAQQRLAELKKSP